jgi:hypothetical protein
MSADSPIFTQTYDLLRWLLPLAQRLPRVHRTDLARQLPDVGFRLQRYLLRAAKQPEATAPLLREADAALAELRLLLRLARDLKGISFGQYEEGARRTTEIGRLLGGWQRAATKLSPASAPTG